VIAFLRFLGLMNAAVWFGAAVFFAFGADPAASSPQMRDLIGTNNFPYFSLAIAHVIATRYFALFSFCSALALLYLIAEWLYFGKYPPKRWLAFIFCLVLAGSVRGYWIEPMVKGLHDVQHGRQAGLEPRELAARSLKTWHAVARSLDFLLAAGLAVYVWRVGNPPDSTRFVSATKFRS
jgi:hypothetical protein